MAVVNNGTFQSLCDKLHRVLWLVLELVAENIDRWHENQWNHQTFLEGVEDWHLNVLAPTDTSLLLPLPLINYPFWWQYHNEYYRDCSGHCSGSSGHHIFWVVLQVTTQQTLGMLAQWIVWVYDSWYQIFGSDLVMVLWEQIFGEHRSRLVRWILKYLQSCHGMQTPAVEMDVVLRVVYDSSLFWLFREALQCSWEIKFLFPCCEQRFNIIIAVIIVIVTDYC